jgi:hypothetical protein
MATHQHAQTELKSVKGILAVSCDVPGLIVVACRSGRPTHIPYRLAPLRASVSRIRLPHIP